MRSVLPLTHPYAGPHLPATLFENCMIFHNSEKPTNSYLLWSTATERVCNDCYPPSEVLFCRCRFPSKPLSWSILSCRFWNRPLLQAFGGCLLQELIEHSKSRRLFHSHISKARHFRFPHCLICSWLMQRNKWCKRKLTVTIFAAFSPGAFLARRRWHLFLISI